RSSSAGSVLIRSPRPDGSPDRRLESSRLWLARASPWRSEGSASAPNGLLGEVALHRRLAREIDPALAIDLDHHDHHLVADRNDILDRRDVVVGELADPDQTLLAGQDLDECAEAHDPGDLAEIERPDLDVAGQRLDPGDRLSGV